MARPGISLWWSGVAAGLSISFSLLAQGLLELHLPDAPWRDLVTSLGYTVGFVMVVLGRQQLFTETTITAVLPMMADFSFAKLGRMLRIWLIVLIANIGGDAVRGAVLHVHAGARTGTAARHAGHQRAHAGTQLAGNVFQGHIVGFPDRRHGLAHSQRRNRAVLGGTLITWLIAAGGFMHIVAGSVEAFLLVRTASWAWERWCWISAAGAARQHRRRHRAVRAAFLRASDEGNLRARTGRAILTPEPPSGTLKLPLTVRTLLSAYSARPERGTSLVCLRQPWRRSAPWPKSRRSTVVVFSVPPQPFPPPRSRCRTSALRTPPARSRSRFWDHWVPGANDTLTKLCKDWAKKEKVDHQDRLHHFAGQQGPAHDRRRSAGALGPRHPAASRPGSRRPREAARAGRRRDEAAASRSTARSPARPSTSASRRATGSRVPAITGTR